MKFSSYTLFSVLSAAIMIHGSPTSEVGLDAVEDVVPIVDQVGTLNDDNVSILAHGCPNNELCNSYCLSHVYRRCRSGDQKPYKGRCNSLVCQCYYRKACN